MSTSEIIIILSLLSGVFGPESAREYPSGNMSIELGQGFYRLGKFDEDTPQLVGFSLYGQQIYRGVAEFNIKQFDDASYVSLNYHSRFALDENFMLGSSFGFGFYDGEPNLFENLIFNAEIGLGYNINDDVSIWAYGWHMSNFNRGRNENGTIRNPSMNGFSIEFEIKL